MSATSESDELVTAMTDFGNAPTAAQRKREPLAAAILLMALLAGCSTPIKHRDLVNEGVAIDSRWYFTDAMLRQRFGQEWPRGEAPRLGLALAGGGTKAADFSLGVLQGLDESGLMRRIDAISTVSGGSYAGLWYFARHHFDPGDALTGAIFRDCLPGRYADPRSDSPLDDRCPDNNTNYLPDSPAGKGNGDRYRYQNYLRGFQDIFSSGKDLFGDPAFNYEPAGTHDRLTNDLGLLVAKTLAGAIANVLPNVIFNWEITLSPSRKAYRTGIARTFGATPPRCDEPGACFETNPSLMPWSDQRGYRTEGSIAPLNSGFDFSDLARLHQRGDAPLWIINSTAGEDQSPWDFTAQRPPELTAFEFTPYGYGSGIYRYRRWHGETPHSLARSLDTITPLDAVISSAAFLDSQQKVQFSWPIRKLAAVGIDVLALNWGSSYGNPNASPATVALHHALPWPFYYLHRFQATRDSAFIHLSDGGQSENLGAYSLIRRGIDTLIISDHAFDRSGHLDDLCHLSRALFPLGYSLILPGLPNLETVCRSNQSGEPFGYDVFAWHHPILLGCIVPNNHPRDCTDLPARWDRKRGVYFARLFVIKPAFGDGRLSADLEQMAQVARSRAHCADQDSPECRTEAVSKLCHPYSSSTNLADPQGRANAVSCEILGFMKNNSFAESVVDKDRCPHFPQYSTISMTLNSSPWMYGVSRELGDRYARQLAGFFDGATPIKARFDAELTRQSQLPMTALPANSANAKAGAAGVCLNLNAREN